MHLAIHNKKRKIYLSQYESHDSESESNRASKQSKQNILTKLRKIKKQVKFLTEDQFDSSKDNFGFNQLKHIQKSQQNAKGGDWGSEHRYEFEQYQFSINQQEKGRQARYESSSGENKERIRKIRIGENNNEVINVYSPSHGQLSQIEALNSSIENQISE